MLQLLLPAQSSAGAGHAAFHPQRPPHLLVMHEPTAVMTARLVKFSEAISSRPVTCNDSESWPARFAGLLVSCIQSCEATKRPGHESETRPNSQRRVRAAPGAPSRCG